MTTIHPSNKEEKKKRRLTIGPKEKYLPSSESSTIMNVPLTKSHFLDAYSKGKWNLSKVPCPACFNDVELMVPPDHYNEVSRLKAVKKFKDSEKWKDRGSFNKLISKALKFFNTTGAAISLVDENRLIVKYQVSLNIIECPKRIAIDAHTILSVGSFILSDASKDWRTVNNPFVKGRPHIRFYAGVPLATKFGAVIGVFSIFDAFPKYEFGKNQISFLQELAEEVISILSSPLSNSNLNTTKSVPLIRIIGRPTSQGNQFSSIAVYEKDGSGSRYSQNFNFRYNKQACSIENGDVLKSNVIIEMLSSTRDIKSAASCLSKIIAANYNFSLCCVVEIRVCQRYQISAEFFPQENSISADNFKLANELAKIDDGNVMCRLLGSHGYDSNDLEFDSGLYFSALNSEFGVFYERTDNPTVKFKAGIIMPFYRLDSKLVRKKKIIRNSKSHKSNKPMEVYLRSGGFLIAAFNEKERDISDAEMDSIHNAACSLRRLFISN